MRAPLLTVPAGPLTPILSSCLSWQTIPISLTREQEPFLNSLLFSHSLFPTRGDQKDSNGSYQNTFARAITGLGRLESFFLFPESFAVFEGYHYSLEGMNYDPFGSESRPSQPCSDIPFPFSPLAKLEPPQV